MVRIITDSAADFEPEELERLNVACIPVMVNFGGREYRENIDLSKDMFYELLAGSSELPHTSQPSPEDVLGVLSETQSSGDEAVLISLSSGLSGTYQSAVVDRNMLGYDNCCVVDSLNATGGQRMLVEYAVRLRDEGKGAAEIAAEVEALRPRIVLYACVDTLEYLYRGGRISGTVYKIGSAVNIKPIITVNREGGIDVPAKSMGMRRGMDYLCKRVDAHRPDKEHNFYVMYTGVRKNGEILAKRLCDRGYEIASDHIINVGPAIGTHVGPNACGLVYIGE